MYSQTIELKAKCVQIESIQRFYILPTDGYFKTHFNNLDKIRRFYAGKKTKKKLFFTTLKHSIFDNTIKQKIYLSTKKIIKNTNSDFL